jgi:hypothetical protein
MQPYVLAFLIGVIAGLRSLTAPAVVSWAARLGWLKHSCSGANWRRKKFRSFYSGTEGVSRWLLVHNAHRIEMRGDSMRKNRGKPSA